MKITSFLLMATCSLTLSVAHSLAQPNPSSLVGGTVSGVHVGDGPQNGLTTDLYAVPAGQLLVLTDFEYVLDLDAVLTIPYLWDGPISIRSNTTPKWALMWSGALQHPGVVGSTFVRSPASLHLSSGIVFPPGSTLNVVHNPIPEGSGSSFQSTWFISWSGYLAPATTSAIDDSDALGEGALLALSAPFPNPVTDRATIRFVTRGAAHASVQIVDVQGRRVRQLTEDQLLAGEHAVTWDVRDDSGATVPAGIYFVDLTLDARRVARRAVVLESER
ncbi:MAG: T9SS type A sorting domain-containing protein [Candidatus Eisenbacteria bacterium]|nr:T9SS type A sorting domain-containing protein [Candidatus Eisenbacteria bacterium]